MRSNWAIFLVWALVLALIYWVFSSFIAQQYQPKMQIVQTDNAAELTLQRARDGHFRINGHINSAAVTLLLDTGATSITLSERLAARLNLPRGESFIARTANGEVAGYESRLSELSFGPFRFTNVRVGVLPNLGNEVLLGMNIIRHFDLRTQDQQMHLKLIEQN
ncbi:TIGR02281 family clan AA aspartic protease [uncultured Deefgea sp.]|uniref:retropepsin-like aspartic protease family protein n=1 Tax=uncultured Deefgea sp. TaxID=1304914 RepID=UPI00262C6B5A|nr:retropepsin-like aspartic protease [uncultured Deefgea sp.]